MKVRIVYESGGSAFQVLSNLGTIEDYLSRNGVSHAICNGIKIDKYPKDPSELRAWYLQVTSLMVNDLMNHIRQLTSVTEILRSALSRISIAAKNAEKASRLVETDPE